MDYCDVADLSPLASNTVLRQLQMTANNVQDISAMANKPDLEGPVLFTEPESTGLAEVWTKK